MNLTGAQRIAAPKERVWQALNDPDVLKQAIPGCQSLEKESDESFRATIALKIGPMDARFAGTVKLTDLNPPNSYTLVGSGQGGPAGFAKGAAKVSLSEESGETLLSYEVDAQVGGRLAQLGGPIIDATAKQLAGKFFKRFGEIVAPQKKADAAAPGAATQPASDAAGPMAPSGFPVAWVLALAVAALGGFLFGQSVSSDGGGAGWAGVVIGLMIIIVAGAGFEFGRRAAAPIIVLDPKTLKQLTSSLSERNE